MRGLAGGGLCLVFTRSVLTGLGTLLILLFLPGLGHTSAETGDLAPPFVLPSLRSEAPPIDLSDHLGKVVYLDFWSSWCAPCRRAMPQLSALRDDLPRDGFEVIAINLDAYPADARRFLGEVPVSYPVAADWTAEAADAYGVSVLPWAVLIDPEGRVDDVFRGETVTNAADVRRLQARIRALIGSAARE